MLFVNFAWERDGWTGTGGISYIYGKRGWLAVHPLDAGGRSGGEGMEAARVPRVSDATNLRSDFAS